ncbi:FAD-dependent thymidylate synthase [Paratractidigestivibacter sp.]|uniref:FAD-dependent thymidylate synthase n=1 Tax=Paratractidigestivibacter sp. TaxID=2847316 RepID=UPI002AC95348|nr:FAD-dependent thymidylate synthase [Paratractidigestivibacter sp.]
MYMTKNETTTQVGQSTATVLARTRGTDPDSEIITWELVYPRYIHSELMTHRMFSRNASSSRATPARVLIREVEEHPVRFDEVRCNQKGMTGGELVTPEVEKKFYQLWEQAAANAAYVAQQMADLGVAKQTVNRVLEPFLPIRVIVTATETDNFFRLRLAPDAQPEIQSLAKAMLQSRDKTEPLESAVHVPYAWAFADEPSAMHIIVRSIAACARVSVMRGDGKETSYDEDLAFVRRLLSSGHMTPFEHVAFYWGDERWYANFWKWQSVRNCIEAGTSLPLDGLIGELGA